ncbi:ABC transporter ATP-binding protein [Amnibacterium setariae]|jgi:ABC-2 type transport system ATP-binding protein|uniref:ABC transporter ATP-binding protein n=1 Tax=Amnibacterium setariae TaxID=2306585 RepID=A0A3A1U9P4_9MICO|nr:ABC transporter ATP-binding protein [Amnibacterium setariae]RIX30969.1 ABC transporter ATP-binding protein [Amnibacterium setariae]
MAGPVISVDGVGVRFQRDKSRRRTLKDMLSGKELRRAPDEFWAFRNVSFDVASGESIGVVGRNGQGKSTLLKMVAEVLIPDEGSVSVRQGVAPLIEITGGFVDDLSVKDNVYLASGLHGKSKDEIDDEFADIIEFAEIKDFVNTPYKHLSSGMKVRVAFSVVSRLDEPILLVDEVLAVGDRGFRRKCYARIEEMLDEGRTLFFVSHSDGDLKRFCQRGLYLDKGALQYDGPIEEAFERYTADYA